ncbi:hypothetical protein SRABI133_02848 [Peribacillus simplex]|uniref:Uncharacterized protein n=2 Tax=Bacillaceae TaxID=186817 RepID=A0A9W4L349_9BACI|nr:hypothetical protein SRABI133_02848 [Peribacillus simplex]
MTQPWARSNTKQGLGERIIVARWRSKWMRLSVARKPIQLLLDKHGYSKGNLSTGMIIGVCKLENNGTQAILEVNSKWKGSLGKLRVCSFWMTIFQRKESMVYVGMDKANKYI